MANQRIIRRTKRNLHRFYTVLPNGCWRSNKNIRDDGYSRTTINGVMIYVHVFMYEHFIGPVPYRMTLDHKCRNRACCNPEHLEPVTQAENVRRGNMSKITMEIAEKIRRGEIKGTQKEIGLQVGLSPHTISNIVCGTIWR